MAADDMARSTAHGSPYRRDSDGLMYFPKLLNETFEFFVFHELCNLGFREVISFS
jgi:hypothetical protein